MTGRLPAQSDPPLHRKLALTDEEFEAIVDKLGRKPNDTELAMFAAMWSEHCSYKSSKVHLSKFGEIGRASCRERVFITV